MGRRLLSIFVILAFLGASGVMIWRQLHPSRDPLLVHVTHAPAPLPVPAPPVPPPTVPTEMAPEVVVAAPTPPAPPAPASEVDGHRPDRLKGESGVTYLIRVLRNSRDFRVRVQVTLSLGRIGSRRAAQALAGALADEHPAVRSSAADALGRIGGDVALEALRTAKSAERDATVLRTIDAALARLEAAPAPTPAREPIAPSGRYFVAIARPSAARHAVTSGQLGELDRIVRSGVAELGGVQLVESGSGAASDAPGFHLDVAVSELEDDGRGTARAVVSVMVSTHPGRELRGIVKGKATIEELGDRNRAAMVALEGAAKSAVRQLPSAFARAAMR